MIRGLRVRVVHEEAELREFAAGFCATVEAKTRGVVKGDVPIEYLERSRVTAVFDHDRMVAGYAIGTSLPLRLVTFVPPEARAELRPPPGASWEDCCEVTCFWRTSVVSPVFMATRVWPRMLQDAIRTGKRFIVGHNQAARLDTLYAKGNTGVTLYAGPSIFGIPSRLSAHATRGLWPRVFGHFVVETLRRVARSVGARRSP